MATTAESRKIAEDQSYRNIIQLLSSDGLDGAIMLVERELEKDAESWEAWAAKADILYLRERYTESMECCLRSIAINPENAFAWNTKGNALFRLKRYGEAIECYNHALILEPLLVRAWHNKKLAREIQMSKCMPKVSKILEEAHARRERDSH
jgi:tetratricopeptide (TPR) repeat protein